MPVLSEPQRLAELEAFGVLDTGPEPAFDDLVAVAAEAAGCPTALISLLDADRQWFKARYGLDAQQTPRDLAFCEHVLRADAPLVVTDARADPRFATNPLVTGAPGIRFYAGHPLRTSTGAILGTLCVIGYQARPQGLTGPQARLLEVLAAQVMAQLELRRSLALLRESESRFRVLFDNNPVGQVELSPAGVIQRVNGAFADLVGVANADVLVGRTPDWATAATDRPAQAETVLKAASAPGQVLHSERTIIRPDGTPVEIAGTVVGVAGPNGRTAVLIGSVVDVTERNLAQRRSAELAAELAVARDEALRRNALMETVLETVGVGIVACDDQGRLTLFNRATRDFHGMPADPDADPADWADRYALFDQDGLTALRHEQIPLVRALTDGAVDDAVMVIAPDGLPRRVVRCSGRAMRAPDGRLLGAVVVMADITQARATAQELAAQAEFTRILLDTAHTAIWSCDTTGRPTYVNAKARHVLGWPALDELIRLHDSGQLAQLAGSVTMLGADGEAISAQDRPLARALAGHETDELEVILAAPDRPRRTLLIAASPLHNGPGHVSGAMLTGHDVTDLRASEARFKAAFHDGPTPLARLDRDGTVREVNPALRRLTGQQDDSLVDHPLSDHIDPNDHARFEAVLSERGTGAAPVEVRVTRADRTTIWCELATTVSLDPDGSATVLTQLLDIDARKTQERHLKQAAQQDPLTSLANRSQLTALIQAQLDAGPQVTAGVLFLDLDGFKAVNDNYGHDAGDAVLVEVARRLTQAVRPGDTVLRLGGDEFVVVCAMPTAIAERPLQDLARRLEDSVAVPVGFDGKQVQVGASVGAALAQRGQSPTALVEAADAAMYRRKTERGRAAS